MYSLNAFHLLNLRIDFVSELYRIGDKVKFVPFFAAGKTGTSQDYRDAWFVGFTDKYIAAVWVGNDDNSPMKGVGGSSVPAEIWRKVMLAAHESRD